MTEEQTAPEVVTEETPVEEAPAAEDDAPQAEEAAPEAE